MGKFRSQVSCLCAILGLAVLMAAIPAQAQPPMCGYMLGWSGSLQTWNNGAPWVKVMYYSDIAAGKNCGSKVFYRPYDTSVGTDDGDMPGTLTGAQYADAVWAKISGLAQKPDAIGYRNEFSWSGSSSNRYTSAQFRSYRDRLIADGYTGMVVYGSWGVGWPDAVVWDEPEVLDAASCADAIETHEYFDLTAACASPWLCYRHRDLGILARPSLLGAKPWFIGEFGSDMLCGSTGACGDSQCRGGWNDRGKLSQAACTTEFTNYRNNCSGNIAAVFVFKMGTSGWANYDVENTQMSDYMKTTWTYTTGTLKGWVKTSGGTGISGATVSTNTGGYTATTDMNGYYLMPNVAPATYTVSAAKSGYNTVNNTGVVVTASSNYVISNFTLTTGTGTISGSVKDGSNAAIVGATVSTNTGGYNTTTDSSGNYTLSNVSIGTYNVTASKTGYAPQTNNNVTVTLNTTTTSNFVLSLSSPGSITGYVQDLTGGAVSGATVQTNTGGYSTTTAADGTYTLANVTAGTYNVTASKTYYVSKVNNGVVVTSGNPTTSNFNLQNTMNTNTPTGTNNAPQSTTVNVDTFYGAGFEGTKAVDGSTTTKWCTTNVVPPHWLALDLGQTRTVNGFVVKLPGGCGELQTYNAKNFSIQSATSINGPWSDEVVVDNTAQANTVARSYDLPRTLRYVRINITNSGVDNYTRLYEFEVWCASCSLPSITTQPQNSTVCAGTGASFSVTATGATGYQWRKGGSNISSATNSSYSIASTVAGDAGSYDVVVSNACGNVTSTAATLTVNTAISITTQPQNSTVCAGTGASFNVVVTGTSPTYQWKKAGSNISGATNSSYSIASTVAGDAGSYTVAITNFCGTVTSNAATLTVNPLPAITTQPQSSTVCAGTGASFSVTATNATSYQWKKAGSNISGATNSSYSIASTVAGDAGNYTVAVTNSCGTVTSSTAVLTVNVVPSITTQPQSQTKNVGQSVTFSVTATGATSYQWKKAGSNITGATASSYTISSLVLGDAGNYTVAVTNSCGTVTSSTAVLTVNSGYASEDFTALPTWSSTFDAAWGSAATFVAVSGGQTGNYMQAYRATQGSSVKAKVYTVPTSTNITITIYLKCPSYAGGSYWMETAYKLGSNAASDFDANPGTWTQIQKFADTGTNGNGNVWTQYTASVNTGANTQITIGYKHGASNCVGPTVGWDTFSIN